MRLTVIGCGSVAPDPERVSSGYLLEHDTTRILFDCGPGVLHHLSRFHADWLNITHLALTHFHYDHIGDLSALFYAWKYGAVPARSVPLHVIGPQGTAALLEALPDPVGAHIRTPGFHIDLLQVEGGERVRCGDIDVSVHASQHTPNAVAFRAEADGRTFGYTGDTGPDDVLAGFFEGVDVLVAECSLPDEEAVPLHLSPGSVAAFAAIARPGILLLVHGYPQLDRAPLVERVRVGGWQGDVRVAADGMVLDMDRPQAFSGV